MIITRTSPRTKISNHVEINVTPEQIYAWQNGKNIQDAMPDLTPDEREFILTGYTPADWAAIFPPEEESEVDHKVDFHYHRLGYD